MSHEAFIYDAVRTPRGKGKATGALYSKKPVSLVADLLNKLEERGLSDTSLVEDVILGCVSAVGEQGGNIAKTAALLADWDEAVAGVTLNRFCASGLEAINMASAKVKANFSELMICGGVESMSHVPMGSDGGAWAMDPECNFKASFVPQGVSADLIATIEGFTRDDLDQFALTSHQKAAKAQAEGRFDKSMIPVTDRTGKLLLAKDEIVRGDSSLESLAGLKPSFAQMGAVGFNEVALNRYHSVEAIQHVHSPGNSSGIVDGAALLVIGNESVGTQLGMKPRARIVSAATVSTEPTIMLTGPAPATQKALDKAGLQLADIDLFEVNEAFASVVLKFIKDLDVDPAKINVNGGAIAMGHPLGATGAMIVNTLVDELERQSKRYGLATLCVGGGMGVATIIERI
ncbi:MAG: acetyl-CoA C-acetyltransferase [Pseudobacteriovorax sp.]|nr:acetyl-CoA C-acetyltransferase [Pseudobacteriovorax sp.]